MPLTIQPVRDKADFARFVDLPYRLYKGVPEWVPPLKDDVRLMFDRVKNPFFQHATVESFLALRDGRVVGRISAIDNKAHNEFHHDRIGFFGFFECEDDPEAANALFAAASDWLAGRGFDTMRGPMNFSTNDDCGSLVDGFDTPPTIMMPHNLPYHAKLYAAAGFTKAKDLLAYWCPHDVSPERLRRAGDIVKKRRGITTRAMNMKDFNGEVDRIREIYNDAWEKNWGFVPMTAAELDHMAKQLKPVVDPRVVVFAEKDGQVIGFVLGLPDFNIALKAAGGELFPLGLIRLLMAKSKIKQMRVLTLGIKHGWRASGVDAILIDEMFRRGHETGLNKGEFSWILEDNLAMRRPLESAGARVYKTYRVYDRPIPAPALARAS